MIQPELIADYQCHIGENPLWHPLEQCLYWTDITRGRLFRYDPATGKHEQCYSSPPVGGFTVQAEGTLLLARADLVPSQLLNYRSAATVPSLL